MPITFRNDQPGVAITVLREVAQWLTDRGETLWNVQDLTADNIINEYTRGNLIVVYVDGEPAATFILQWLSPLYWPEAQPNTSGFIHKLAIRRSFAGQNLFAAIVDYCRSECQKRGITLLQLETDATRPKLMQFYERHGFRATYQRSIEEFDISYRCQYYDMTF
jgi:GNAT superfamily N-acetyltransferase